MYQIATSLRDGCARSEMIPAGRAPCPIGRRAGDIEDAIVARGFFYLRKGGSARKKSDASDKTTLSCRAGNTRNSRILLK
jgi:hypothetical protein